MRRAEDAFVGSTRFQVRGRLGDGGGGVVYRARDLLLDRDVAVKVMRDAGGEGVARFRASFPGLKRLSHPNLVQLLDLVEDGARLLLIMELVDGLELHDYVRHGSDDGVHLRGVPFDELRLRSVFLQLAQALYTLHGDRKVHRDVKPSNVRVTPEGRAVLLDLDLSLDLDAEQRESVWPPDLRPVGTAAYMAPEQASSEAATPASDWYSFGVVLYEALTGALPFRGTDLEILLKKQDVAPTPPEELVEELPADLAALCRELLMPQPARRPVGVEVLRRLGQEEETVSQKLSLASILSARATFVGREHEMERLLSALQRSRGGPYVVRVTGEPGAGKTTLCEELLRRLAHDPRNALTLAGRCPRYPDRPHAALAEPVVRVVEALRDRPSEERLALGQGALRLLERMFGASVAGLDEARGRAVIPPDPLEQRFRAIESLRAMLAALSASRPLVLWLDDYQWADVDTQRLIGALLRGGQPLRMLLVLSEDLPAEGLQSSLPTADELIALTGLTRQAARALAAQQLGERSRTALAIPYHRDTLPLVIQERARFALLFGQRPDEALGAAALLDARVGALPAEARKLLEIICTAHDPLPQEVCERASGLTRARFSRQLGVLRVGALVRCFDAFGEDFVAPSHWAVASVLEGRVQLAGPQIHGMLASALQVREQTRASARLLRHQAESGDQPSAAQSALAAAQEAERALSFRRAAELLLRAASLKPAGQDAAALQLKARIGDALSHAGASLAAADTYREAGQLAKGTDLIRMRQRAVEHYLRAAEHELGARAVRELLECFELRLPTSQRAAFWGLLRRRALVRMRGLGFREASEGQVAETDLRHIDALWATGVRLIMVDMMRGADLLARGVREALRVGEPQRVARALCTETWIMLGYKRSHLAHVTRVLESARALIERQPAPFLDAHLKLAEGMVAMGRFALPEAYAHFRDAERVLRSDCTDVAWEITMGQVYQIISLTQTGRFAETAAKYETSTHEARERGDFWGHAQLKTVGAIGVKLVRDLPNEAAEDLRESLARWNDASDLHMQHVIALLASTYVDLYRGVPRALEALDARWGQLKRQFFLYVRFQRTTMIELRGRARVLCAKRRKDPGLLRGAEADARILLAQDEGPEHGFAHMLLANIHAQRGHGERALSALRVAVDNVEAHGLELWSLTGRYALGRLLGGDSGAALREHARGALHGRGVVHVGRLVSMMLPGFEDE